MRFDCPITVEFNPGDPAGMVFYRRYFEMVNATVERFFAGPGWSFGHIHLQMGSGVPLVRIAAAFLAPLRLSDALVFSLALTRIGGASAEAEIVVRGGADAGDPCDGLDRAGAAGPALADGFEGRNDRLCGG